MVDDGGVLILTNGSRGDCQPFAALALALQASGRRVLLVTNPDHENLCRDLGVPFRSNRFPTREWFTSDAAVAAFKTNNLLSFLNVMGRAHAQHGPNLYRAVWQCIADFQPKLIICGLQHNHDSPWIPRLLRVPVLNFVLANSHTQNAHRAPYGLPSLPLGLNKPIWWLVFWKYISDMKAGGWSVLSKLSGRPGSSFLPSVREMLDAYGAGPTFSFVPYVICQDEGLCGTLPTDKPWFRYVGHLTLPEAAARAGCEFGTAAERAALSDFIMEAPDRLPLVYIGWGSVQGESREHMACLAVRTLKAAGCRGVILGGWAQLTAEHLLSEPDSAELVQYARQHALFVSSADHDRLFPRCAAIVHHGGIGTTISAMRSGTPSVVTPIFFDQFDSAKLVHESGQGIGLSSFSRTTPSTLAAALQTCITDPTIRAAARELGVRLRARDGCREAVELVNDFLKPESVAAYWENMDALLTARSDTWPRSWWSSTWSHDQVWLAAAATLAVLLVAMWPW